VTIKERAFKPLDQQALFHLITVKREELYNMSSDKEELTDSKIVAISQELDSLIAEYQKGLTNYK
jgi:hypothetical protein